MTLRQFKRQVERRGFKVLAAVTFQAHGLLQKRHVVVVQCPRCGRKDLRVFSSGYLYCTRPDGNICIQSSGGLQTLIALRRQQHKIGLHVG